MKFYIRCPSEKDTAEVEVESHHNVKDVVSKALSYWGLDNNGYVLKCKTDCLKSHDRVTDTIQEGEILVLKPKDEEESFAEIKGDEIFQKDLVNAELAREWLEENIGLEEGKTKLLRYEKTNNGINVIFQSADLQYRLKVSNQKIEEYDVIA